MTSGLYEPTSPCWRVRFMYAIGLSHSVCHYEEAHKLKTLSYWEVLSCYDPILPTKGKRNPYVLSFDIGTLDLFLRLKHLTRDFYVWLKLIIHCLKCPTLGVCSEKRMARTTVTEKGKKKKANEGHLRGLGREVRRLGLILMNADQQDKARYWWTQTNISCARRVLWRRNWGVEKWDIKT